VQFFYWNANFDLGIAELDAQHRRLVELINALAATITDGGTLPEIDRLLDALKDYAIHHFAAEERVLDRSSLSESEKTRHRASHRAFARRVQEIADTGALHSVETAERILEFLTSWLVTHMLVVDHRLVEDGRPGEPITDEDGLLAVSPIEQVLIRALGETERRFRLLSDNAPALIWVAETDGRRGFVNRAWCDFVGLAEDDEGEVDWASVVHPDDLPSYRALVDDLVARPRPAQIEYRMRRADGDWAWILERILPRRTAGGTFLGLIASGTDVTAIKRSEAVLAEANRRLEDEVARRTAEIERLMLTDPLTGLGNRRFLTERLESEIERAEQEELPLVVAFADLDHFKQINDRFGHRTGDAVLAGVGHALIAARRPNDVAGRYGGEEFVLVFPETRLAAALPLCERLRRTIGGIHVAGLDETVEISIGLAARRPGESADSLLARADRALYRAKENGRNRCLVDDGGAMAV
jgi:diguanylate cyclase (GGDEF)-like protein/hemerythrin-like metal-binding protein/PAS domain S-box-containing protein